MKAKNINLGTDTIQSFLKNTTTQFFATKGINRQNTPLPNFDVSDSVWNISSYSSQAQSILTQFKSLVNNYTVAQHSYFISQCSTLKTNALNLSIDNEALSVGSEVSVAINSFTYWKDNAASWQTYLVSTSTMTVTGTMSAQVVCGINLKQFGGSDIGGAIGGARVGVGGGPEGAVAGAIVGAAISSAYDVTFQALQCTPGVVGRVSRWLSDWF